MISPDGMIAKAYDLEADGLDFSTHAQAVIDDIKSLET